MPEPEPAPEQKQATPAVTAGRFASAEALLAFLAAVSGTGLAEDAICRRAPDGTWWCEIAAGLPQVAPLVWAAGGEPFAGAGPHWYPIPATTTPAPDRHHPLAAAPQSWPTVELAELLGVLALRPGRPGTGPVVEVVTPGPLGRWVLSRGVALGLSVSLTRCRLTPLTGAAAEPAAAPAAEALLVRLTAARGSVPVSLVMALAELPGTWVCRRIGSQGGGSLGRDSGSGPESGDAVYGPGDAAGSGSISSGIGTTIPGGGIGAPLPGEGPGLRAAEGRGLLIDLRCRPPLTESLLADMVPEDELWLLGPAESGHRRLRLIGGTVDGAALVAPPAVAASLPAAAGAPPSLPAGSAQHALPAPLPIAIIARPPGAEPPGPVEAILVDDRQLGWLATWLAAHPAGDRLFVILGPGRHLLTAPEGVAATVPFGVPLTRIGPGGLFLELGLGFFPPLPASARARAFGTGGTPPTTRPGPTGDRGPPPVVAVTGDGCFRFDPAALLPAWMLWIGPAPAVTAGLSPAAVALLASVAKTPGRPRPPPRPLPGHDAPDTGETRRQAEQALLRGDLVGAARLFEQAGDPERAGRLYEKAAHGHANAR